MKKRVQNFAAALLDASATERGGVAATSRRPDKRSEGFNLTWHVTPREVAAADPARRGTQVRAALARAAGDRR